MRWFVMLACVSVAAAAVAPDADADDTARYNVVILSADALRSDMLGVNGNREVGTPNIDALAAAGVNFERAYTTVTTTTPSFASLLTSVYPSDHGVYSNTGRIDDRLVTLPEILGQHGWHTAAIVNLPWLNPDVSNIPQGIQELARCKHIRKADRTNRWILDFLDRRKEAGDQPFFLWVHYIDNHTPYHAPGKYARMYYPEGKDPRAGSSGSLQRAWKQFPEHHRDNPYFKKWLGGITDADYVVAAYKGSVTWLDEHVGAVIARLKRNRQWENTLLVFLADHGESLGEHGLWFLHGGLYEPTARIPLILRVPGGPAGRSVGAVVSQVDVLPTILARLGLPVPVQARGKDLWPLLGKRTLSGGAALLEHAGFYFVGVVTPRYKYIRHRSSRKVYPAYPMKRGREELYDLDKDPGEKTDIARQSPDLLAEMRALLGKLKEGKAGEFEASRVEVDEQTEEMLRSLGYTQ